MTARTSTRPTLAVLAAEIAALRSEVASLKAQPTAVVAATTPTRARRAPAKARTTRKPDKATTAKPAKASTRKSDQPKSVLGGKAWNDTFMALTRFGKVSSTWVTSEPVWAVVTDLRDKQGSTPAEAFAAVRTIG